MADVNVAMKAEQLSRRRARMLPVLIVLFLAQQATYLTSDSGPPDGPARLHIAAWLVLSIVILIILATGGGWIYSRAVRQLANDEGTRVHRDRAFRAGFIASMSACIALYFVAMFEPLTGREAIHVVMTVGILVTLVWFAFLERRAHSSG